MNLNRVYIYILLLYRLNNKISTYLLPPTYYYTLFNITNKQYTLW